MYKLVVSHLHPVVGHVPPVGSHLHVAIGALHMAIDPLHPVEGHLHLVLGPLHPVDGHLHPVDGHLHLVVVHLHLVIVHLRLVVVHLHLVICKLLRLHGEIDWYGGAVGIHVGRLADQKMGVSEDVLSIELNQEPNRGGHDNMQIGTVGNVLQVGEYTLDGVQQHVLN